MLKGILICCGFLIAQLMLLHYVDQRVGKSQTEVRYTQSPSQHVNTRNREGTSARREEDDIV